MDGNSRMILHNTTLRDTYGITMDFDNQVLYWADFTLNKIESSNADGSNRRTLTTSVRDPYSISYYIGQLYWGDNSYNRILTGPVTLSNGGTFIGGYVSYDPHGIHVVSKETQPEGWYNNDCTLLSILNYYFLVSNPCLDNNGNCSHFCLLSSSNTDGLGCECPNGMFLGRDRRTCSFGLSIMHLWE